MATATTLPGGVTQVSTAGRARRVKIAGAGAHMQPAFAQHTDDTVTLVAMLKAGPSGGTPVRITAPRLSVAEGQAWVRARVDHFTSHPGARESPGDAIRRKALAAQGEPFIAKLKKTLPERDRMELAMMLSPDSHAQGDAAPHSRATRVAVSAAGVVTGLDLLAIVDSNGHTWGTT